MIESGTFCTRGRARRQSLAPMFAAAITLLAAWAIAAGAQGRRRGGPPADPSAPSRPSVAPVLWEPEQIFPLAIAHAGELHLTDQQQSRIETIGAQLRASNAPLLSQIDTLRPPRADESGATGDPAAPSPAPLTAEQIAAVVARRHALGDVRAQLHENTRLARAQLDSLLSPDQQQRLAAEENAARQSAERGDRGGSSTGHHGHARVGGDGAPPLR
jgi:hypothetical protein